MSIEEEKNLGSVEAGPEATENSDLLADSEEIPADSTDISKIVGKKKMPLIAKIGIVVLALALIAGGVTYYFANRVLDNIEKVDVDKEYQVPPEWAELMDFDGNTDDDDAFGEMEEPIIDPDNPDEPIEIIYTEPDLHDEEIKVISDPNVTNILLIGSDSRTSSFRGRADTIIICSINSKTNKITLVSILRDTYVKIPGYKSNKINTSYAYGGMKLLDKTIEQNLGVHIDYNVVLNFQGFANSMAQVGRLDISLTKAEANYLNKKAPSWNLKEGVNSLTPAQALAYARIRKLKGNDWGRTERQRKVIMAAFNKYKSAGLSKVLSLLNNVTPYMKTDMSNGQMVNYVKSVFTNGMSIGKTYAMPTGGDYKSTYIRRMAVLVPNLGNMSKKLHKYLYGVE